MMTLDEAIKTCEENVHDETYGEEIRQLREWLKELRDLRSLQRAWEISNESLLAKLSRYNKLIQDFNDENKGILL